MNDLRIGLVGARGHVGAELIRLIAAHPRFELGYVTSRERTGQPLASRIDGYAGDLHYTSPVYEELPELGADAVVGVDIDYEVIGQSGSMMMMVSVSGTAVKLK